ncbi:hypothetical protein [Burkholderia gladioli]|uniref:hypothetical protein n=1 Tax=Burkholderia gladioli TaxID=28095 RepID=UPI003EE2091E
MSRNMIEANTKIFSRLAEAAREMLSQELIDVKRAVATDAEGKRWLKNVEISSNPLLSVGLNSRFAIGSLDGERYLLSIGIAIESPPADFELIEINSGAFTAFVAEMDVGFIRTRDFAEKIREYVFYPTSESVEKIDVEVIRPFFAPLQLFRVHRDSPLNCDRVSPYRTALAAVLGAPSVVGLPWSGATLERLDAMARNPHERVPFHVLLRAVTETRPDAAFLAVYRCVEQLFPVPKIAELSADLKLDRAAMEVAASIERHLSWRRREDDAIAYLFEQISAETINRLATLTRNGHAEDVSPRSVSRRVYELRNQCVHYRPIHGTDLDISVNWMEISDTLLEGVEQLYAAYNTAFPVEA